VCRQCHASSRYAPGSVPAFFAGALDPSVCQALPIGCGSFAVELRASDSNAQKSFRPRYVSSIAPIGDVISSHSS
jgi:hypothetical protein